MVAIICFKSIDLRNGNLELPSEKKNLNQALEQARKQSAKIFELSAAKDLAILLRQQGKGRTAHDLLQGVYDWFTEGFDSVDLQEARSLLTEFETGD